jgi:hypothetical protein
MKIMTVTHRMKCYKIILIHFKSSYYTEAKNGDKLASFMSWQISPWDRKLGGLYS